MPVKHKESKVRGYNLIILCVAALVLGSIIPLVAQNRHSGPKTALIISEIIGAVALVYVFAAYLLKK